MCVRDRLVQVSFFVDEIESVAFVGDLFVFFQVEDVVFGWFLSRWLGVVYYRQYLLCALLNYCYPKLLGRGL